MADLSIRDALLKSAVTVDASATTFLTGDLLAGDGSGNWLKADADVLARQDCQWICMNSVSAGGSSTYSMPVCKRAIVNDTDAPYTAGALLFLSATAGLHTATQPTVAAATVQRCVGKAISTSEAILDMLVPHYQYYYFITDATALSTSTICFGAASRSMRMIEAKASWVTASTSGLWGVFKSASGTAIASGTNMGTGTIDSSATAATPVAILGSATAATARIATGQNFGIVWTGTLTSLVGFGAVVTLVDEQLL